MRKDNGRQHDKSEVIEVEEGYKRLAAYILIQAYDDYRDCGDEEIVFRRGEWLVKSEIKWFFKSKWCEIIFETLTDYPIAKLLERMRL